MKKGFTLIELLIVVAIIAILAAIAVPNFLEAQVRAKISRAKSDMNAMKVAAESYMVDNGTYPFSCCPDYAIYDQGGQTGVRPETTWKWFAGFTTPIAYISTLPLDPFSIVNEKAWGGGNGPNPYHYYSGNGKKYANNAKYQYANRIFYMFTSPGPDGVMTMMIDKSDADAYMLYIEKETNRGGKSGIGEVYDASNGTKSGGDIYTFGGRDVIKENNATQSW